MGGTDETSVDVRVISATNIPLETLIREKRFREDLFYRLNVIPIRTPPLRERREDIPLLAEHFLRKFAEEMGKTIAKISEPALQLLLKHSWPGNVRELENVVERAVALETHRGHPARAASREPARPGARGPRRHRRDRRRLQPRRPPPGDRA